MLAGPAGALFGILIGNIFDRGLSEHYTRPHQAYHTERSRETQEVFLETTWTLLGFIAKSDGRVSENEIVAARQIMDEMRLSHRQRQAAKRFFNIGKEAGFNPDPNLYRLRQVAVNNRQLLHIFCDFIYRMARTDVMTEVKRNQVNRILQYYGFAPLHKQYHTFDDIFREVFEQYHQQTRTRSEGPRNSSRGYEYQYRRPDQAAPPPENDYTLLGVPPSANKTEVKRAYRRMISKHHPDRLIARGASEAEIKRATDMTQKLARAYERICKARGW